MKKRGRIEPHRKKDSPIRRAQKENMVKEERWICCGIPALVAIGEYPASEITRFVS